MTGGLLLTAARIAVTHPRLWAIALAGFLARGGIVVLALPIVVLPSVVGVATFVGPTAVSAAGLSDRLVVVLAGSVLLLVTALALGIVVGSLADLALFRDACLPDVDAGWAGREAAPAGLRTAEAGPSPSRAIGRLALIRLIALVPLAAVAGWGAARLVDVSYVELTLPSDLARPFILRVLAGAPEVVVAIVVAWLAGELVGAVAVRLAIVEARPVSGSLRGSLGWIARRLPLTIGLLAATLLGSGAVMIPAIVASAVTWQATRTALLGDAGTIATLLTVVVFVALWGAGLVLAGIAAAWRSLAWSLAVLRDHRGTGPGVPDGGTL